MWQCHYCRSSIPLDMQKKNRLCPSCGSDLHCCKNCTHYDETLNSQCREPNSPWIRDRNAQNTCPFFEFRHVGRRDDKVHEVLTEAEKAKEAFRALFRNL